MTGLIITDGAIENLESGWALMRMINLNTNRVGAYGIAHYWDEVKDFPPQIADGGRIKVYEAKCGRWGATHWRTEALSPGNWDRCKQCERALGLNPVDQYRKSGVL